MSSTASRIFSRSTLESSSTSSLTPNRVELWPFLAGEAKGLLSDAFFGGDRPGTRPAKKRSGATRADRRRSEIAYVAISITEQGSQTMYTPSSPLQSKQPFVWGSSMLALS